MRTHARVCIPPAERLPGSSPGPCRSWRLFKRLCVFSFCVGVVCTACACFLYPQTHTHTRTPPDISSITAGGQVRDCKTEHRLKRLNARYNEAIECTLQSLLCLRCFDLLVYLLHDSHGTSGLCCATLPLGVTKEVALPSLPARHVRPMRCTLSSMEVGMS